MLSFYYDEYKIDKFFPANIRELLLWYREGLSLTRLQEIMVLYNLATILIEEEEIPIYDTVAEYESLLEPYQSFSPHPVHTKPSDLKQIYEMYMDGMTTKKIAKTFNTHASHIQCRLREVKRNNDD